MANSSETAAAETSLASAVAAGFAWVVSARGALEVSAVQGFLRTLEADARLAPVDRRRAEHAIRGVCQAMMVDAGRARAHALDTVRSIRNQPYAAELVLAVAELASRAPLAGAAEETAMSEIQDALRSTPPALAE